MFGQSDHLRRYGRDFAGRVAAAGFDVETVAYIDGLDPANIDAEGLLRKSDLFPNDDVFIVGRRAGDH